MTRFIFVFSLITLVYLAGLSLAAIPKMINYQGMLTQSDGKTPVTNANYPILFSIYNISSGGSSLWSHTYNVSVTNGLFNIILGDSGATINLAFDTTYWLGIKVGTDPELSPRIRLTSVGYAYRAQKTQRADTADIALSAPGGSSGNTWNFRVTDTADTTLITGSSRWGIARYGNTLYGNADSTHVNLGVTCTTGTSGQNLKYCTVGGGRDNTASGYLATVGGGYDNTASVYSATVGGGEDNTASGFSATVGGGSRNNSRSSFATVGGGYKNSANDDYSTVGGGGYNDASGLIATIGGGYGDTASGDSATVGGGVQNTASGNVATVGGGKQNTASGSSATLGGGKQNNASGDYATVGGGGYNDASGLIATVGGGYGDTASGDSATVGGGVQNTASGNVATVGGGKQNTASGSYATVGGGRQNTASESYATVGGGKQNTASGNYATVGGGYADTASGDYSFAAGNQVRIASAGDYTFAFGNNFTTSASHAVVFHDASTPIKVGIGTTSPAYTLDVNGDAYISGLVRGTAGGNGALLGTRSGGNSFSVDWTGSQLKFYIEDSHVKTFVIDHPLDESKYLVHGTLEGAEAAVYYRGTAQLTNGITEITLPSYFETLVRKEGRTILLTNIDGFDRLAVKKVDGEKIRDGRFVVVSDNPTSSQEFDWEVKAIRQDVPLLVVEPDKKDIEVRGVGPYTYPVSRSDHGSK